MKLHHLVLAASNISAELRGGACNGDASDLVCDNVCEATIVGRNRMRRLLYGLDSWSYYATGTGKDATAAQNNYRNIIVMSEKVCTAEVLQAFADGHLTIDLMDKAGGIMNYEADYLNMEQGCWASRRGLFLQFSRTTSEELLDGKKDLINKQGTRDNYYVQLRGVDQIDTLGLTEDAVNNCMTAARIDYIAGTDKNSDYTKCRFYDLCKKDPDWDPTDPVTTPATTTKQPTTAEPDDGLPDYNNLDYTVECNGQTCTVTAENGLVFIGEEDDNVVKFRSIPYAEPPVDNLRWKAPVLITDYSDVVDASNAGAKCMTKNTDDTEDKGFSEDCLFLNVQVKKDALVNKEKMPILFFIHGGGFNGGTGQGDNDRTVTNQDVMMVGVNYRLGPFGFFYLNEKEADQEFQGNWGLLDQQAGMKWISMFAGLLGGDKNSVTITGGSAGSESCWRHFTMPGSWPYFTRAAPVGIGLVAGSKSAGVKTQRLTDAFYDGVGCAKNDLACMRSASLDAIKAGTTAADSATRFDNTAMVLNSKFAPVHTSDMFESTLFNDIANGRFKPNTDLLWSYTQWEAYGMSNGFLTQQLQPGGLIEEHRSQFFADKTATGHMIPYPYPHYIYEKLFGSDWLPQILDVFGCTEGEDCDDQLARFAVATQFACSTKYALDKNFKGQRDDVGIFYPVQYEEPTCDKDEVSGEMTKACHGAEGGFIRGTQAGRSDFGDQTTGAFGAYYRDGFIPAEWNLKSYEQMNYSEYNAISSKRWVQTALRQNWAECDLLDKLHEEFNWYNFGMDGIDDDSMVENTKI